MIRPVALLAAFLLPLTFLSARAEATASPLASGFAAYAEGGARAALVAWFKGSPVEGSKEALAQANVLAQVEEFYGPYRQYSVTSSKRLSENTEVLYVTIEYLRGPLFAYFLSFRQPSGSWAIVQLKFHTEFNQVWPSSLYTE